MTSGRSMSAIRRIPCPHRGQASTSNPNVRRMSAAQDAVGGSLALAAPPGDLAAVRSHRRPPARTMAFRQDDRGASRP